MRIAMVAGCLVFYCGFATPMMAQELHTVTLTWEASPEPDPDGYNVWQAEANRGACPLDPVRYRKVSDAPVVALTFTTKPL